MAGKSGIDVSHWNGDIDFQKVKLATVDFVMIKAGGSDKGFYMDSKFNEYYSGAKKAKLNVGAYYFVGSKFDTTKAGVEDAKRFMNILRGKQFEMPVVLDIESTTIKQKDGATEATIAFCKEMEKNGYYVAIYASDVHGFHECLNLDKLTEFDKWVARYNTAGPKWVKDYGMWQFSCSGQVYGIKGTVDMDYSFKDYPKIIKKAKLNGWT